ncbi:DNA-binding protein [Fictibacillus macauensis ZFHKF-1]|uniref:DNA-binding protein n=1 Tax=Fictibacillus macauensis ZFHKF-1 TaxID=1196324 RepID=I8AJC4_9BACL|nr:helix-turn-helix transcriptional regulator [Fictibacillus macauensis]EIT85892.1 DNA-binding protein [Fictibacillus macauensis ZFHKF-1]
MVKFRCNLEHVLKDRGIKKSYVAEKAKISRSGFSLIVQGKSLPTLPVAIRIGKVLNLPIEKIWIIEEEED